MPWRVFVHGFGRLTGPTRSGTYSSKSATFPNMKKKPNKVTRFGASQSGSNSTNPFHYSALAQRQKGCGGVWSEAHVVFKDISRYEGFIDARVLVRMQMLQRVFGNALMLRGFCGTVGQRTFTCVFLFNCDQIRSDWRARKRATYLCSEAWRDG